MEDRDKFPGVHYIHEKTNSAVYGLATSTESLQRRLATAYIFNMAHAIHDMEERNGVGIPEHVVEKLKRIEGAISAIKINGSEGLLGAIESQMSADKAQELIDLIVEIDHMAYADLS